MLFPIKYYKKNTELTSKSSLNSGHLRVGKVVFNELMSKEMNIKCAITGVALRYTEVASIVLCRQILQKLTS